jgi:hypothetical protein
VSGGIINSNSPSDPVLFHGMAESPLIKGRHSSRLSADGHLLRPCPPSAASGATSAPTPHPSTCITLTTWVGLLSDFLYSLHYLHTASRSYKNGVPASFYFIFFVFQRMYPIPRERAYYDRCALHAFGLRKRRELDPIHSDPLLTSVAPPSSMSQTIDTRRYQLHGKWGMKLLCDGTGSSMPRKSV